ncbi:hypothetical protein G7046_g6996 [Stylonectria norvegica]|nr:hypothetical protein G7046_g6996 [Stylonectria norvegica]
MLVASPIEAPTGQFHSGNSSVASSRPRNSSLAVPHRNDTAHELSPSLVKLTPLSLCIISIGLTYYLHSSTTPSATMISDNDLYRLAIFLGSSSMILIVLYHFLEVNSADNVKLVESEKGAPPTPKKQAAVAK